MDDHADCKPYVDETGNLVFPKQCDEQYCWWGGGKKLVEILVELKVSKTVWQRYSPEPYPEELHKENYPLL
ncbi:uncharacterized protein DFE_0239 [Desulfovibrio ferrophilus]|uniref:Uncharacterized protein n=2 Tax=Desulfovibrio ferrophilus TaxID=241368 RepID=A0A2Z6AUU3_9BACT|nr:uncharacterized protein DFE_0239 [Desulfovibrio ferrophilus]